MESKNMVLTVLSTVFKITIIAVIILGVYNLSMKAYAFGYDIFYETSVSEGSGAMTTVTIVEGKSVKEIGKILEEKGLIKSATLFYVQEIFSPYQGDLKPGVYELSTSMTPQEMMAVMAADTEEDPEAIVEEDTGIKEDTSENAEMSGEAGIQE